MAVTIPYPIPSGDTFAMTVTGNIRFEIGEPPSPFTIDEIRVKKAKGMELTECPSMTFPELLPNSTTLENQYHTTGGTIPIPFQMFNHETMHDLAIAPDRDTATASPAFQLRYSGRVANATSTARITY